LSDWRSLGGKRRGTGENFYLYAERGILSEETGTLHRNRSTKLSRRQESIGKVFSLVIIWKSANVQIGL